MAASSIQNAVEWVKEHPFESALIGIGGASVAAAAYLWFTDESTSSVFKKAPSVSFLESTGGHVDVRHQTSDKVGIDS
jgi:hypothetical protein